MKFFQREAWIAVGFFLSVACAQLEDDVKPKQWFWNSTTTVTAPQIDENHQLKNVISSTPATSTVQSNATEPALLSPEFQQFVPVNVTSGFLAELFSDDFAPANITRGRSSKAMDLGDVREGRILNDDPGNKRLSIQGFIPIVSLPSGKALSDEGLYYKGPTPADKKEEAEKYYVPNDDFQKRRQSYQKAVDSSNKQAFGVRIEDYNQNNFYIPNDDSQKTHRQGYQKAIDSNQKQSFEDSQSNQNYYIPPPQNNLKKQKYIITPDKETVRYVSANEYHNRPYQHDPQEFQLPKRQDNIKSESSSGHFLVTSNPQNEDEDQYSHGGPYAPEPIPTKERYPAEDTTAKQQRPVGKQFSQDELYELQNGNYILSGGENGGEDKCICVPFYLCRNGYLTNYGRSFEKDDIDERSARKISKRSIGNETVAKGADFDGPTLAPYTEDIMARMIGLNNVGDSCGLLRRCCRVPQRGIPGGLLPFSPSNYPIPQQFPADLSQLPPGLLPPGLQGVSLQQGNEEHPASFIVNQDNYPQTGQPQEQQIVLIPQEVPPPHRRPRPVQPHPNRRIPGPSHIRPVYPQRRPTATPVYQPQPSYPKPQQTYPPHRPPKPVYTETPPSHHQGQCGARNGFGIHGRVNNLQYHDDASEFGEYPWQAAILLKVGPGNNLFVCGGTLISNQWVATAAHCLKKHNADELKVRLGDWDVHRDDEFYPYVEKYVVEVVVHPDFYPGNLQNDLALLRLESPVDANSPHISPACLPEQNERFDNLRCWVTGWGKNAFGEQGEYQSVLKEVDIPMLNHRDCEHRLKQTRLGRSYKLHPGFLCAGGEPGKDACTGDGGSPLVCEHGGTWKVAGLVSWGIGCGQPGVPGIYVNMAKYRNWIETVIYQLG